MKITDSSRVCRHILPIVLTAGLILPATGQAVVVDGIVKLGLDFGGDTLVAATLISGSSTSTEKLKANEGLVLAGGVSISNDARNFFLDTTLGWKSEEINASNQEFKFSRYPLDVLGFYGLPLGNPGKFTLRLGGGVTYHINPKFSASGTLANGSVSFDDAVGLVGQIDTVIRFGRSGPALNAGLRYTSLDYEANGVTAKANGAGLFVGGRF